MSWTIKTLKKYFNLQFKGMSKALKLARKLMNKRLDEMNEVRAQLDRQVKTFVSLEKFDGAMNSVNQKIESLSRLVYIGLGIWLVLQLLLSALVIFIFKK